MSEETAPVVEEVPVEEVAAEVVEPEAPAWRKGVDEAPADELLQHPKFKGILGSELEKRRLSWEADLERRNQEKAREEAQAELDRLAEEDPDAFAARYKTDRRTQTAEQEIASLRSKERDEIGKEIGRAIRAMPEHKELTAADHEEILTALAGKSDEQVIALVPALMTAKFAEIRARKQVDTFRQTEAEKLREAIRLEEQSKLLQNGDRPGIGRTRGNGTISDEPNWRTEPQKWEAWYSRQTAGSRR